MDNIDLLKHLVSTKSVTPDDGGLIDFIDNYLADFKSIRVDKNGVKNIFLYKEFLKDGDHLCFAGHLDVVPAGDDWKNDPFKATEIDGYIYGRGTQDMKSGVSAFVNACKNIDSFNGSMLSILLTSDEEGDATDGTVIMLEHLKDINMLPNYVVVAEPTCEDRFGDYIKVGRRGSINGYLTVYGKQGHAAYPQKAINPIHQISTILNDICLIIALMKVMSFFSSSKLIVTDIRSGMKVTNVTPNRLDMMFNVRNAPLTTQKDIKEFINKKLEKLDFELKLTQGSYPFVTNKNSKIVKYLKNSIKEQVGVDTQDSTAGGTSDARFFARYGIDVVEFGVLNNKIHAVDESVLVSDVESLYKVFFKTD